MYRRQIQRGYQQPNGWTSWTAGLVGGALGMMVMGAVWYVRSQSRSRLHSRAQRESPQLGQAPSRSHVQMASHPARQL
jgi:hypothetical protein